MIKITLENSCAMCGDASGMVSYCQNCYPLANNGEKRSVAKWDAGNIVLTVVGAVVLLITAIAFWGEVK